MSKRNSDPLAFQVLNQELVEAFGHEVQSDVQVRTAEAYGQSGQCGLAESRSTEDSSPKQAHFPEAGFGPTSGQPTSRPESPIKLRTGRPQRMGCLSPDIFRLYSPLVAGWYVPARR